MQRISMLFRSEPGWEAIGEFSYIGKGFYCILINSKYSVYLHFYE